MNLVRTTVVACVVGAVLSWLPARADAQAFDTTPPALVSLAFSPTAVDVSAGPQNVTVTVTVTDDLAGVSGVWVQFLSATGNQRQPLNGAFLSRVSGTALNAVHRGTVEFPRFAQSGLWRIELSLSDAVGNSRYFNAATLQSLGIATELTVSSVPDIKAPDVTNIDVLSPVLDVSNGPQQFRADLTLTDDLSGVDLQPGTIHRVSLGPDQPIESPGAALHAS